MLIMNRERLTNVRGLVGGKRAATGRHAGGDVVVAVVLAAWVILLLSGYLAGAAF